MRSRLRPLQTAPVLAAIVAAVVLVWFGDGRDGFWSTHPMLGALVSGAFLFAVGVLLVDRFVGWRNARRWRAVSTAADRELGHLIDETLKAMWTAHSPPDPDGSLRGDHEWTPASRANDVRPGREQVRPARRPRTAVADLPPPDYTGAALTPFDRLEALLQEEEFVLFARRLIAQRRDEVRESVKGWAALMMWAEHSQRLLNHLSVFAEVHLSDIEFYLADWTPEKAEGHARKATRMWCLADVKGRVLFNAFWGDNTPYRQVLPEEIEGISLVEAFRRPGRVGRWRPPPDRSLSLREYRQEEAWVPRRWLRRLADRVRSSRA